ncbi:MAG: TOBE domain-containing protein [Actinomycetota bacterium]
MAEVIVNVHGIDMVALITKDSAQRLALAHGTPMVAIIKATDVMMGVE